MLKHKRKFLAIVMTGILIISTYSIAFGANSERLSGNNRYETSTKISQSGWSSSEYVVIASGKDFADALCAVPLAKKLNAPIILTDPNELSTVAIDEIKRLNVKNVYIAGGEGAVSANVKVALENTLKIGSANIKRLYGKDRFETSVAIAKEVGIKDKVALVYGGNYADALSIAPIAAIKGIPILLTDTKTLPDSISNYLSDNKDKIQSSYVIGGEGVVSPNVKNSIEGMTGKSSKRLSGSNRYDTNINVLKEFENDKDIKFDSVYMAVGDGPNGDEFADALSGAVLCALKQAPLILTYKELPKVAEEYLQKKVNKDTAVIALGGVGVMPEKVIEDFNNKVKGENTTLPIITPGTTTTQENPPSGGTTGGTTPSGNPGGDTGNKDTVAYNDGSVTVEVTDKNICIKVTGKKYETVVVKIESKGSVKFIDQTDTDAINGKCEFKTILGNSGLYTLYVVTSSGQTKLDFEIK